MDDIPCVEGGVPRCPPDVFVFPLHPLWWGGGIVVLLIATAAVIGWLIAAARARRSATERNTAVAEVSSLRRYLAQQPQPPASASPLGQGVTDTVIDELIAMSDLNQSAAVGAQIERTLNRAGAEKIAPLPGERFNPDEHSADSGRPVDRTAEAGTVAALVTPGWRTEARVIRPAEVTVWVATTQ